MSLLESLARAAGAAGAADQEAREPGYRPAEWEPFREVVAGSVAELLRRVTVRVHDGGRGGGAGVVWRQDGIIVTNAHVAHGGRTRVELSDGRVLPAQLLVRDLQHDLAVLRIAAGPLPTATPRPPGGLRVGELVVAMGHPLGVRNAISIGIVHAVEWGAKGGTPRWIRADVRLAPGNSGGPLADAAGSVIGINSLIHRGLGYAVPSSTVERLLAESGAGQLGPNRARDRLRVVVIGRGTRGA